MIYSVNSLILEYLLLGVSGSVATFCPSSKGLASGKDFFLMDNIRGLRMSTSSAESETIACEHERRSEVSRCMDETHLASLSDRANAENTSERRYLPDPTHKTCLAIPWMPSKDPVSTNGL